MPVYPSGLNLAASGLAAARWVAAFTADPTSAGNNEVAGGGYARQQTTWGSVADGDTTGSQVAIPIPAGTTVTHWGVFSAASGGTPVLAFALAAPEVFGSAGVLNHTPTLDVDPA